MNLFSKIQLLPSSWIVKSIHRLLLSVSCCLPIWGAPKLWQFNEHFELWILFSLWGQGHKSLQVSPHPTPVLERERIKASLLSTPPFFLLADQKNSLSPSKPAITNPAISMSLSASCSEPNVIFLEATCDSRSVIHQDDQIGEGLPGLYSRKLCCAQINCLPANISSRSPFTSESIWVFFFFSDMTKESIKSYFYPTTCKVLGIVR